MGFIDVPLFVAKESIYMGNLIVMILLEGDKSGNDGGGD